MPARVDEGEVAGLRWLRVTGERDAAFRALGDAARDSVRTVLDAVARSGGRLGGLAESQPDRRARVLAATRERHPAAVAEAEALAHGAGIDPDLVLLANLRGDLGRPDGTGCSDLGWHGARSFLAHNEDGGTETDLTMLSLHVDGEPPVAVEWYPGFLPSNSFVVTGHGLTWGIDHLMADWPGAMPGRHFVARSLQRCTSLDEAVAYLANNPSAGGFAYTIGELGTGRVATVEAAAGRTAAVYAARDQLLWHTNHVRYVDAAQTYAAQNSLDRGKVLDALTPPATGPDTAWFLDILANACLPDGVNQPDNGRGRTLCTAVVDLTGREVTLQPADGTPVTLAVDSLLAGP